MSALKAELCAKMSLYMPDAGFREELYKFQVLLYSIIVTKRHPVEPPCAMCIKSLPGVIG